MRLYIFAIGWRWLVPQRSHVRGLVPSLEVSTRTDLKEVVPRVLKKWLSREEHMLHFYRTQVLVLAPMADS